MATPLNARTRKISTQAIDPDLKSILEDYNDTRVFYDTIQLTHSTFKGKPHTHGDSYYLVNHTDNVVRGGIKYLNFAYNITLPERGSPQQTINITLDNTDGLVQEGIEGAMGRPLAVDLTYRMFVQGKDAEVERPIKLKVEQVSVTDQGIQLTCSRPDLYKRLFPQGMRYDDRFKGLYV